LRRRLPQAGLGQDARDLQEWLHKQLEQPRIRGLVGWLLAQAAARVEDLQPAGGVRTLIFTEYADSVDYIAVVLQLLALLATEAAPSPGRRGHSGALADVLLAAVEDTVALLHEGARSIQTSASAYVAPVPPYAELFQRLDPAERRARVLMLAAGLGRFAGLRTGDGAARLLAADPDLEVRGAKEVKDLDGLGSESDDEDASDSDRTDNAAVEAVVDAFAPWYRIEPNMVASRDTARPEEATAVLRRLDLAAKSPLYTLISTEVLAEGVNLQECGVVVHFDLPWNPTRLIQRNGRVDRRIQVSYESRVSRELVWERLLARAGVVPQESRHQAPSFQPPKQVYHLTIVPPEPELHDDDPLRRAKLAQQVSSVRRTLFRKLRSIQILFGLASWPIVLRAEEARAVLDGELEVETPGFRRREELFARRGDLRSRLEEHGGAPPSGTLTLTLPGARFREEIARRLAGAPDPRAWADLREAGVQSWSASSPSPARAVRSGPEWGENVRALTAWGLFVSPAKEGLVPRLLRWATTIESTGGKDTMQRRGTAPALIECGEWDEDLGWMVLGPQKADLRTAAVGPNAEPDLREQPVSPTDASEEVLHQVAEWLLREKVLAPAWAALETGEGAP
jgi:hypothetical protein